MSDNSLTLFEKGPLLPADLRTRCIVAINDSAVFIVGSPRGGGEMAFILDIETGIHEFLPKPIQSHFHCPGCRPGCAVFTDSNGHQNVMIAGGSSINNTEYLNLDDTRQWMVGPQLPFRLEDPAMVKNNTSFILIGGWTYPDASEKLLGFNPEKMEWIILPQVLTNDNHDGYLSVNVAIPLETSFGYCDDILQ